MAPILSRVWLFALPSIILVALCSLSDCYDPLDPTGNMTVTFDIFKWTNDGYVARVTIQNYYQYRHVEKPGWTLGWTWASTEVIWSMSGAFATQQGNCSSFRTELPHSCSKDPLILDLMPDALPESRSDDCCQGGLLSAWGINPSKSLSSFEITVGNLPGNSAPSVPVNLTLMAPGPGYTCGPVSDTDPTVSTDIDGRRKVQVYRTWKSTCTYSSFLANKAPVCCVSLSTFYCSSVTSCRKCSCGCREVDKTTSSCISANDFDNDPDVVRCSDHMCPIQVHWHVKNNYMSHWRVKLTVSNFNYKRNLSDWNALVQHPGFKQNATTYSFNSKVLPTVGFEDEVALFWGIDYYNTELPHADQNQLGSVTTEILLEKDLDSFTLRNGWALPRRIYFNGENCEMPLPDTFPMLPNNISSLRLTYCQIFLILLTSITLVTWF